MHSQKSLTLELQKKMPNKTDSHTNCALASSDCRLVNSESGRKKVLKKEKRRERTQPDFENSVVILFAF